MPERGEAAIKWWMRYVIVPVIAGLGIIALVVFLFADPPAVLLVPAILLAAGAILWMVLRSGPTADGHVAPPMTLPPRKLALRALVVGTAGLMLEAWMWVELSRVMAGEEPLTDRLLPSWWVPVATALAFVGGIIAVKLADEAEGAGLLRAGVFVLGLLVILGALPFGCLTIASFS